MPGASWGIPPVAESEPNSSSSVASALPGGQCYVVGTGAISPVGDQDFWSFPGTAGASVWAYVDPEASTDPFLEILQPDGATVIEHDDNDGMGNGGGPVVDVQPPAPDAAAVAGAVLTSTGTHFARVTETHRRRDPLRRGHRPRGLGGQPPVELWRRSDEPGHQRADHRICSNSPRHRLQLQRHLVGDVLHPGPGGRRGGTGHLPPHGCQMQPERGQLCGHGSAWSEVPRREEGRHPYIRDGWRRHAARNPGSRCDLRPLRERHVAWARRQGSLARGEDDDSIAGARVAIGFGERRTRTRCAVGGGETPSPGDPGKTSSSEGRDATDAEAGKRLAAANGELRNAFPRRAFQSSGGRRLGQGRPAICRPTTARRRSPVPSRPPGSTGRSPGRR
jgi:hypothetical protein